MKAMKRSTRGRKPSIAVAAGKVMEIRREMKSLTTALARIQDHLNNLDAYYSNPRNLAAPSASTPRSTGKGRGPNVRDHAYRILKGRKSLPIQDLAKRVARARGGKAGAQFAQNLGVALSKDGRFKKVERGVYAAK